MRRVFYRGPVDAAVDSEEGAAFYNARREQQQYTGFHPYPPPPANGGPPLAIGLKGTAHTDFDVYQPKELQLGIEDAAGSEAGAAVSRDRSFLDRRGAQVP